MVIQTDPFYPAENKVVEVVEWLQAHADPVATGNVLGLLEETMARLLQARDCAPDIRDDEQMIREVLGFLQRVCVAAMVMGAEHESSVMALRFPRIQRASVDLIVETLRMVKEELAGKPFCNKRDAAEFLTKYIIGKESQTKGITLVMSAARRLKWE